MISDGLKVLVIDYKARCQEPKAGGMRFLCSMSLPCSLKAIASPDIMLRVILPKFHNLGCGFFQTSDYTHRVQVLQGLEVCAENALTH